MQAIIFTGIQASGKSSYYKQYFFNSHVRISMDLLNTRNKEKKFLTTCLATQSKFLVDNTNPTQQERAKYIETAKAHKFEVIGYFFDSSFRDALARNNLRKGKEKIPEVGLKSFQNKLEIPQINEGFDRLYKVSIENGNFITKEVKNEV